MRSCSRGARRCLWVAVFILAGSAAASSEEFRPTKIVFVRHAETAGNATGNYQEPNQKVLTARGRAQASSLVGRLSGYRFDAIVCSPRHRVKLTLLPYLESTGSVAEVWTDLDECGDRSSEHRMNHADDLAGKMKRYFRLGAGKELVVSRGADETQACDSRVEQVARRLRERFAGRGLVVLVAGHGDFGRRLLDQLTGLRNAGLDNVSVSEVDEVRPGQFELVKRTNGEDPTNDNER